MPSRIESCCEPSRHPWWIHAFRRNPETATSVLPSSSWCGIGRRIPHLYAAHELLDPWLKTWKEITVSHVSPRWHSQHRARHVYAFQLAHLNLTMPFEVMPRESIISPTRENIERILRTENKKYVIASLLQQIRLERGGSKRIIRASEITHKYQRSRHQTEEGENGSRPWLEIFQGTSLERVVSPPKRRFI